MQLKKLIRTKKIMDLENESKTKAKSYILMPVIWKSPKLSKFKNLTW